MIVTNNWKTIRSITTTEIRTTIAIVKAQYDELNDNYIIDN